VHRLSIHVTFFTEWLSPWAPVHQSNKVFSASNTITKKHTCSHTESKIFIDHACTSQNKIGHLVLMPVDSDCRHLAVFFPFAMLKKKLQNFVLSERNSGFFAALKGEGSVLLKVYLLVQIWYVYRCRNSFPRSKESLSVLFYFIEKLHDGGMACLDNFYFCHTHHLMLLRLMQCSGNSCGPLIQGKKTRNRPALRGS